MKKTPTWHHTVMSLVKTRIWIMGGCQFRPLQTLWILFDISCKCGIISYKFGMLLHRNIRETEQIANEIGLKSKYAFKCCIARHISYRSISSDLLIQNGLHTVPPNWIFAALISFRFTLRHKSIHARRQPATVVLTPISLWSCHRHHFVAFLHLCVFHSIEHQNGLQPFSRWQQILPF